MQQVRAGTLRERARKAFAAGLSRKEIAEAENVTYPAIYRVTRDMVPTHRRGRTGMRLEDGRVRSDAMRADYDEGLSVKDIAEKYSTSYQLVWQITCGYLRSHTETEQEAAEQSA